MAYRHKKKQDDPELKKLQQEFEDDFGTEVDHTQRSWVRGEVVQRGNTGTSVTMAADQTRGALYRPQNSLTQQAKANQNALSAAAQQARELAQKYNAKPTGGKSTSSFGKKGSEKKKSNLELFKEEIKAQHDAREAMKAQQRKAGGIAPVVNTSYQVTAASDQGDPNSTNIFISAISTRCSESDLMPYFGRFGPLASVKIMYPRSEEEKLKGRNCAFVAFCCRKDAERCMSKLQNTEYMGHELKLGWGKSVPNLGTQPPIYVPERLKWLLTPPKPSQLPLNAQPPSKLASTDYAMENLDQCTVRVVIPNDMQLVRLINRTIQHVVLQGPIFEAMLMDKESNNPMFQFLFDYTCPAHTYYRWRLFSILNGESLTCWRTQKFRMYEGGPLWKPPILPFNQYGMPSSDEDEDFEEKPAARKSGFAPIGGKVSLFGDRKDSEEDTRISKWDEKESEPSRKNDENRKMPSAQRNELDSALNSLSPVRDLIGDLMALCLEQVEFAQEVVDCIVESITDTDCNFNQRLARLYLVSDILYNSTAVPKASKYRQLFDVHLTPIFEKLHKIYSQIESRFVAEQFRTRVSVVLRAWAAWSLFTTDTLVKLNNVFIGLKTKEESSSSSDTDSDVDGVDIDHDNDSVDGEPIKPKDDVDGVPMNIPQPKPKPTIAGVGTGFVQSKWEVVDDEDVKNEAVTSAEIFAETKRIETHKMEQMDDKKDAKPMYLQSNAWRKKIRDIEVKVIEYCEQLKVKEDSAQAEQYRSTLIRSATEVFKNDPTLWEEKIEKTPKAKKEKKSRERRSRRSRSRSRSRERRRRSFSRSRSRSRSRDRSRRRRR